MELIAFLTENTLSSLFLLLAPFLLLFVTKKYYTSVKNLPPGPRPWPIIGNIHQIGDNPHESAANFAKKYGPLISIHLGSQLTIVASTPESAMEVLKTQDRHFSGRCIPDALHQNFISYYFVWAGDCNEHWKSLRTLCRNELFSVKAIEAQSSVRNEKMIIMLDFLRSTQGEAVGIGEVVFTTMLNTLSSILFNKDFLSLKNDHEAAHGFKENLEFILKASVTPNISDFFPILGRFDLQGLRKNALASLLAVATYWEGMITEKRAGNSSSSTIVGEKNFMDSLLEHDFTNEQINILVLELFIAGTDTITSTIEWAMADLIKNKEAMFKVQEELKMISNPHKVHEYDLSKLSYLNACIKETLRLHPVVPLLIPRRALETTEVMNYTIPQNAQVWINVWAISRDPKLWDEPLSFKPERFLGSKVDFRGQDFEFLPFGAGRRMCPGLPSGVKSLQSILSSLLLQFDWSLPNGEDPAELNMNEKFGVTLQMQKTLEVVFKPKK